MRYIPYCLLFVLLSPLPAAAQVGVRSASEVRNETIDWMKKVADWQLTQSSWDSSVSWERGALHAGMMACYEATKDEKYLHASRQWAEKFNWQLGWNNSNHADNMACAQAYLELYFLDKQDPFRYQDFKEQSDAHVALWPRYACSGTSSNHWWWCDALFMAPPALVQLSRATGDSTYTNFMHMMWKDTQDCLYDTDERLFYRDTSYFWPAHNYNGEKVFWSRGNGWVIAGTARMLQYLPLDDPNRPGYITLLQEMGAKLAELQLPDGYWHSDLLSPERYDNPETSGTGFFTFGIAWGINNGFLDEATYWPTVEAGWEALKAAVRPNGLLGWVQPVGADPRGTSTTTTDVFGVGAYLLAGSEVQKYRLARDPASIDYFESYLTDAALRAAWVDGTVNATASQVSLGDYGDNFMALTYRNGQVPYRSETDYTFASPKNFAADDAYYLSVLVRGDAANAGEAMYVRLTDAASASSVQILTDPDVVRTAEWMEIAFPLSDFNGIDLAHVSKITIGVGLPDASLPGGEGTIRVDNIRLYPCVKAPEDFDGNCKIDLGDFAIIAAHWLEQYGISVEPADPGPARLIAYYPLDGNYDDAAGDHHAGAIGNPAFINPGYHGQSIYFNSASGLNCQNSADIHLTAGATVSAWVKSGGLSHTWASVVTKGLQAWRLIRNENSSAISFHFNKAGGGEYQANGSTYVLDNEWHHLMGVYDGKEIRLYVDGQLDASSPAGPVNTTADPVYIGSRVNRLNDRSWDGQIDEVRIYDTALDETGLLWLSEGQSYIQIPDPPRPTDLVVDGIIDLNDLQIFMLTWLQEVSWP